MNSHLGGRRPRQRHHTTIAEIRDEDLASGWTHGDATQDVAQLAHTRHGRRVEHAQDGAVHGQHLHAMLVSDHQRPGICHLHGLGVVKPPRLRASRAQSLPHGAIAQVPQDQPTIISIDHHDHGALLQ